MAGLSERMGTWKPAILWEDEPLGRRVVSQALRWCHRVIVVTGNRQTEARSLLDGLTRLEFVHNAQYVDGMFSSIQTALPLVQSDTFLVVMADMPNIPDRAFERLLASECETWARPVYRSTPADADKPSPVDKPSGVDKPAGAGKPSGASKPVRTDKPSEADKAAGADKPSGAVRPGHPVRIHRRLIPELLELPRRAGTMRTVLHRYDGLPIPFSDPGVILDVDRPEDLAGGRD